MTAVVDAVSVAAAELKWYRDNPEPGSFVDKGVLTLWNFPVAKDDVAPAHVQAIEEFARAALMQESPEHPQSDWAVTGHASVSGKEESNEDLGLRRAKNVEAVLKRMGLQSVRSSSVGSSDPEIEATDPLALARNRRVTVLRKLNEYRVAPDPPPPKLPDRPTELGPDIRVVVNLQLPVLPATKVQLTPYLIGELRVFLKGSKTDPVAAGVITVGHPPALTEEFAKFLAERVIGPNLGVSEGEGRNLPPLKVAIQAEEWFLTPKIVYGPGIISFNFKAVDARLLPVVDYNGAQVYLEFSGSIRFDIAPPDTATRKYLSTTDPGPAVTGPAVAITPTDTDPLLMAEAITDASKKASRLAQEDVQRMVVSLARRDGAACRVAWEVLGDAEGRPAWEGRKLDWGKRVTPEARAAWIVGSDLLEGFLIDLEKEKKGARKECKDSWKAKYTAGGQTFEFIRESAFQALKGYDEDQGDLPQLIKGL